ncbi:hypothetical protein [Paramicrobacterium chengjingii]|uniref:FHA domain-containing protein n=1 Tax=Paramicrobacterium chengjingii TaxID=2769067 RepID=A0ABX6YJQ6_9MICO|nr:hypothetical protein [Microbacterium chengjingii]QPZ39022.1 hypothetical protein HCR76_02690 [Microbacterium chengjingii]
MESNDAGPADESAATTHSGWGAGNPRLRVSSESDRFVYDITTDIVNIGSAESNELRIDGAAPLHATVHHDENDEYVLTLIEDGLMNANPEATATEGTRTEILRQGARFTAGPWTLVFARAEFADHGRPFGGREGGEFSDQPAQQRRPDHTDEHNDDESPYEVHDG